MRTLALIGCLLLAGCVTPQQPHDGAVTTGDVWGEIYCAEHPAKPECRP